MALEKFLLPKIVNNPKKSLVYVAKNNDGSRYFRVKLIEHDIENKQLRVDSIDYGIKMNISDDYLFYIEKQFTTINAIALQAKLHRLRFSGEGVWSSESINFFKKHASKGTKCVARLNESDIDRNCLNVDLFINNQSIRTLMHKNGYALELR